MHKLISAAVAVLALSASLLMTAPAAQAADTPGCVTRAEYRAVKKGMTKVKVHRVFDTAGKRRAISSSGGYAFEVRTYKVCRSRFSVISIGYDKKPRGTLKLSNKTAVFVG